MPGQRYKITVAYRGSAYYGWQRQLAANTWKGPTPPPGHGIPTIQEILSRTIGRFVGHPINLVGSSRTDSGVHAKGQVAHFDTEATQIPPEGLRRAVNHRLPPDILVRSIEGVDARFDAIGSTISKRYQYFIWNAFDRPPFFGDLVWHRWKSMDLPAMVQAAKGFVGEHDFTSFARPGHQRETTVRTIRACGVSWRGPRLVIAVEGNGFLWHMVRIMVGTLVEVGLGRYPPQHIAEMLDARDRRAAGPTAPPQGLYLQWIRFAGDAPQVQPPPVR